MESEEWFRIVGRVDFLEKVNVGMAGIEARRWQHAPLEAGSASTELCDPGQGTSPLEAEFTGAQNRPEAGIRKDEMSW